MDTAPHIVPCAQCGTSNRVPAERLSAGPKCGKCKQPLFDGHPITLTDANFAGVVGKGTLPVVVDFWAPWCGPCISMAPHFERAASQLEPGVRLAKLDTEAHSKTSLRLRIRSIPTMIMFKDGEEVARTSGSRDARAIAEWVRENLGKA
ncbi:MAG TPA: thioredoxin TrxC [Burkholderiales bacterium]|nr:thioredoxin TrxC [Burkholderiales bacterium]